MSCPVISTNKARRVEKPHVPPKPVTRLATTPYAKVVTPSRSSLIWAASGMSFGRQHAYDNFRLAPPTLGLPSPRQRPQSASPRLPTGRAAPRNLAKTWHQPFVSWEQQAQRSAQGATRPLSAAVSGRVALPQGQPAYPKPKPRPATAFVTNDRGHLLPGSRKSPQEPGSPRTFGPSAGRNVFSPRETYPWRTSLPLPSSLDWGESTPRGMRLEKARAPTTYRPQSSGASRWPDAAHYAAGYTQAPATTAGCRQAAGRPSSAAARDLAAMIRPASVARCVSAR